MLTDAPSDSEEVGVAVVVPLELGEELKLLDTVVVELIVPDTEGEKVILMLTVPLTVTDPLPVTELLVEGVLV